MSENKKPQVEAAKLLKNIKMISPADKEDLKATPGLHELLVPIWRANVLVRQPGRMTIKPDGSAWRVSIECPTEMLQTSFVVDSLRNLMQDVEKIVTQSLCHWGPTWERQKKYKPSLESLIE